MKIFKWILPFIFIMIFGCSGGGNGNNEIFEGYAFSYSYDTLYITYNVDAKELTYKVINGVNKNKQATYELEKIEYYKQMYQFKQGSTLVRLVRFSYDYKNNDDNHMVVMYIKDSNFPEGLFAVGMLEKIKERPVPQFIKWADGTYSGISLTSGNDKSDYRKFYIRNFAREWFNESSVLIEEIFEPSFGGRLEQIKPDPYTYEYKFNGYFENTHFLLAEILADNNTYIAKIYGDDDIGTVNDIEIGIKQKTIHFSEFTEGQRVWIICNNGKWAEGVVDDFNPEPLEDIDRPKIDFTFDDGKNLTVRATFSQNLCETLVDGSFACDFMYSYILDPIGQIIVLNNMNIPDEDESIDCIGGW